MSEEIIVIVALERALPSALLGLADMLNLVALSNSHSPGISESTGKAWSPQVISASVDGKDIIHGQGQPFKPDCALQDINHCHGILVPGFCPYDNGLPPSLNIDKKSQSWLRYQHQQGAIIGGSCSGAFVLGEAGLLNNRHCTTTWWLHYELTNRFPKAKAAWGSALVEDSNIITAGGPLSWVDICLHIIAAIAGKDTANRAADFAVVDANPRSQDRYIPQGYINSTDPFLIDAENTVRQYTNTSLSTTQLAELLSISERTLHRRLKGLTGEAPKSFISRVKMDIAKNLLMTSRDQINTIALELGYSDDAVFRRLFRKQVGMSASEYRALKKN